MSREDQHWKTFGGSNELEKYIQNMLQEMWELKINNLVKSYFTNEEGQEKKRKYIKMKAKNFTMCITPMFWMGEKEKKGT